MSISLDISKLTRLQAITREFFETNTLAVLSTLALCTPALAQDITGAGLNFVFSVLSKWSVEYSSKAEPR